MLPALARTWSASKLRHGTHLEILERLRYFTSYDSSTRQQNQEDKKKSSPAPAVEKNHFGPPPTEPATEECCGKGCDECVWTVYWNNLRDYQIAVAEAQGFERPLDPFEELEKRLRLEEQQRKK